jgi:hypothetical protein
MNPCTTIAAGLAAASLLLSVPARADEWDSATADDGSSGTSNVLAHGSVQVHDLGAVGSTPDQDWYRVTVRPRSSYELVIDGQTGDLALQPADFERVAQTGTVLQSAIAHDLGHVLRLSWRHDGAADTQLVRVRDAACGTGCTSSDRYRIRFRETTYTIPRFNNTATQTTVMLIHNFSDRSCRITYHLLTSTGAIEVTGDYSPRVLNVFNTAQFAPNQSGAVRITHDCEYGALAGKAVAVEPATGFTFDTPLRHRAN